MSEHGDPKNGNGNGRSPPPPPLARPIRNTAAFAAFKTIIQPQRPEPRPTRKAIEPVPDGAKSTASIRMSHVGTPNKANKPPAMGRVGAAGDETSTKGNTVIPPPFRPSLELEKKAAENEARFLRFANALYRASEIMKENWVNWIADPALLREKVGKAVEYLKGKRNEDEKYASDYKMLKAFSSMISKDEKLNDYLAWVKIREDNFSAMAHAYAKLSMGPLTPYLEVLDACEEMQRRDGWDSLDTGFIAFSKMLGNAEEYEGTDYIKGEMYRNMFDAWYVRKSAEAMFKVYDVSKIVFERGQALLRAGALAAQIDGLKKENETLARSAGSNVPPGIMEEVHNMRAEKIGLEGENESLRGQLRHVRDAFAERGAENETLQATIDKIKMENASLKEELAREKETSAGLVERIRLLVEKTDDYEARMRDMEGRIATMESHMDKVKEEKMRIAEELALAVEPDLPGRETMVSGVFPAVTPEETARPSATPDLSSMQDLKRLAEIAASAPVAIEKELLYGVDREIGAALDGVLPLPADAGEGILVEESGQGRVRSEVDTATAVSMVPAVEARLSEQGRGVVLEPLDALSPFAAPLVHPEEEATGQIDIEGEGVQFIGADPAQGIWATKPGKAVKAIFAYGFAGKGMLPPKPLKMAVKFPRLGEKEEYARAREEQEREDERFEHAMEEYNTWYNKAGRVMGAGRRKVFAAVDSVADFYSMKKRQVKLAAAGVIAVGALAAVATVGYMNFGTSGKIEEVGRQQLSKPAVVQVDSPDVEIGNGGQAPSNVQDEIPAPEPLAKPLLADVLAKHGLELGENAHMVQFYKGLEGVTDVQERYIILAEALGNDAKMEGYERRYVERPILEMYTDFLDTAMEYSQLEGQPETEMAGARELGETVSKRLAGRIQQKRIKEKLGKEAIAKMGGVASRFDEFAAGLPAKIIVEEEELLEVPVVTAEQLKEMKKAGEVPESGVILLPDKTADKPFDMQTAMAGVISEEFESLDTPSKVNDFERRIGKADGLQEKFLMNSHLTSEIIEHGLSSKMSEKRVLSMHIGTMNSAVLFAMEEGQGMTAVEEAMNVFELADGEVKRLIRYKGMRGEIGAKRQENLEWLRNRAEELRAGFDAYERNKNVPIIPFPGSPALENGNGAPTAVPEKVTLDRYNKYAAMQTVVFSGHGLSIPEHPLKVYQQMRGMKINHFDRFMILDNLAGKVVNNPVWMDGLSKAEQFEMLRILASYLRETRMAANEPKNWREGFEKREILLNSLAIEIGETVGELMKLDKAELGPKEKHLRFQMDQATYQELGEALKAFERVLNYEYKHKKRKALE